MPVEVQAVGSFETSVTTYLTTRRHNPEVQILFPATVETSDLIYHDPSENIAIFCTLGAIVVPPWFWAINASFMKAVCTTSR
jgi:hypothetical protein